MAGTLYPSNKFSIHSILGDGNTAAVAAPNPALRASPGAPTATLVSMQEAALRAAYCAPYSTPCQNGPTTAAPASFHPATHPQFNSPAAVLRPHHQQTPVAWQPVTFYQDPRSWHLGANTDGFNSYSTPASCVGCYGYEPSNMPLSTAHTRTPFSFGALKLKRKKTRTVFTRAQIDKLETTFNGKRYLSSNDRVQLALALKMTETQVKVWFQNRRNKWKREMATKSVSGGRQDLPSQDGGRLSSSPEISDESEVDVASEIGSDDSADITSSSQGVSNTSTSPGPYVPFGLVCR